MHLVVQNSIALSEKRNGGSKVYFAILTKPYRNRVINFINTVEPWCNEGPKDWKNMFAVRRFFFPYILLLLRRRISFIRSLYWAVRYIVVSLYALCIKIVVLRSSISPGVPFFKACQVFSNYIQNTENSLFRLRYKLALFIYYKYTILERPQWFKSFSIACV